MPLATEQILSIPPTAVQIANAGNSYTSNSVSTFTGRVSAQNTSGGAVGQLNVTVKNTEVTANSVLIVSTEANAYSVAGVEYHAQVVASSRVAGVSFQVTLHRVTPSASANLANNEGCTINYVVFN